MSEPEKRTPGDAMTSLLAMVIGAGGGAALAGSLLPYPWWRCGLIGLGACLWLRQVIHR